MDEFRHSNTFNEEYRGRQPHVSNGVQQPVYKKNMSSPSKMFKQFNPHMQASRSPFRG
jgi:hypothetical protein